MAVPTNMPEFFPTPEPAWVQCNDVREIGGEVACSVPRLSGDSGLVITSRNYFSKDLTEVWAVVIGAVPPSGRLVDFPSGDRLAVPERIVKPISGNGSSL